MDIELDFIRFCFTEEQQRSGLTCENLGGDGRNSGRMSNSSCKGHEHFQNQNLQKKRFWTDDFILFPPEYWCSCTASMLASSVWILLDRNVVKVQRPQPMGSRRMVWFLATFLARHSGSITWSRVAPHHYRVHIFGYFLKRCKLQWILQSSHRCIGVANSLFNLRPTYSFTMLLRYPCRGLERLLADRLLHPAVRRVPSKQTFEDWRVQRRLRHQKMLM